MAHILTGGSLFNYGLKPLAKEWLGMDDDDLSELMTSVKHNRLQGKKLGYAISNDQTHGKGYIKSDMWLGDKDLCKKYALQDTERTMLLYLGLNKEFKTEPKLYQVYLMEMQLMKVLYKMEGRGIRVFPEVLKKLEGFYKNYYTKWLQELEKLGCIGLNLNSPKQLVDLFCIKRGHSTKNRTDTGLPSVNAAELVRLSKNDILAKAVLECRTSESMLSKFVKPYTRFMARQNGVWVLHPNFHQCGTTTGRLSCSDPNLQQAAAEDSVKKRAEIGLKPREAIGPRPDCMWYLPDFSQMEVWVFAFLAKDQILMDALLSGQDIHMTVAKQVWGNMDDWEMNSKIYRKKGKTMMFLKQYGGTSKAASELMDCSRIEAQEAIDEFDYKLPGVSAFVNQMSAIAEQQGYIQNPFGRKYYIDFRYSYKAVNYLVQGTCAEIIKRAKIRIAEDKFLIQKNAKLLMTLHDELIIELLKKDDSKRLVNKIIKLMQTDSSKIGIPVSLPITVKVTYDFWSNAKELESAEQTRV
jgi:DNA polymerase-1